MSALWKFMRGLLASPLWVKLWLGVLMAANMVVPLVYFDHLEARIVLIAFFAGFVLLVMLTGKFGFSRILGLATFSGFHSCSFCLAASTSMQRTSPTVCGCARSSC